MKRILLSVSVFFTVLEFKAFSCFPALDYLVEIGKETAVIHICVSYVNAFFHLIKTWQKVC